MEPCTRVYKICIFVCVVSVMYGKVRKVKLTVSEDFNLDIHVKLRVNINIESVASNAERF